MSAMDAAGAAPPAELDRRRAPARSRWRFLPWLVLAAGAAFLAWLLAHTRPGVFFSGDGGLKFLLVQQFARGGLHPDLRFPVEPWVKALWDVGYFPFDWPFTYLVGDRTFAWCPLPFEYLTAPAYALLGWRGLYVWPVLGLLAIWLAVWRLCRRLDVGPPWTALALFAVIFCSPITIYGAIFWEKTLGVALAMTGLTLLVAPALRSPAWNGLLAGLVLGLSVWFRSEMVWLAAVTTALLPFARALGIRLLGRGAFAAGLALAGVGLLTWNAFLYGDPLGITSRHLVQGAADLPRLQAIAWIFPALMRLLWHSGPAIILAAGAAVTVNALRLGGEARGQIRLWTLLAAAFALGVVFVLPNTSGAGGEQIGPRYLLVVFPMASIVLAIASRALWEAGSRPMRAATAAALALGLIAGVRANAWDGAAVLADDYASAGPVLDAVRSDPALAVVVTNQYMAQELAAAFDSRRFFLPRSGAALERLGFALGTAGQRRFLVLSGGPLSLDFVGTVERQRTGIRIRPIECIGALKWCLNDASLFPIAGP